MTQFVGMIALCIILFTGGMETKYSEIRPVAMATCGIAAGARPVLNTLADEVQKRGLTNKISVTQTGCICLCQYEPIVEVMEPGKDKITYEMCIRDSRIDRHGKGILCHHEFLVMLSQCFNLRILARCV